MTEFYTESLSPEQINAAFIDKIDQGQIKEAMEAGSSYIRQRMYENGVLRRYLEPKLITPSELDPSVDDDKPRILVEKEPNATKATFVPYKGTSDHRYFEGLRYAINFGKVESDRLTKNKFELMTSRMDIMSWLKQNQMYAIQKEEDGIFFDLLADIITDAAGDQDDTAAVADTFIDAFNLGVKGLTRAKLPCGCVLMHKNTYIDSSKLKVEEIGDEAQAKRHREGEDGEGTFRGKRVITTIEDDLIAEGVMWFFAPPEYFVKHYTLQDVTLYLKAEADMITFHSYEAPGVGIGNTKGVFKVTLA